MRCWSRTRRPARSTRAARRVRADLMPYGVRGGRAVLETVSRYLYDDGLTSRRVEFPEVFAKETLWL